MSIKLTKSKSFLLVFAIIIVIILVVIVTSQVKKQNLLSDLQEISSTEKSVNNINKYTEYVGYISCNDGKGNIWSGSGSIWKYKDYKFLTNYHVIEGAVKCQLLYDNPNDSGIEKPDGAVYDLDIGNALVEINDITDFAIIGLKEAVYNNGKTDDVPLIDENFKPCPEHLPLATSVFVIGFPATTQTMTETEAGDVTSVNLTITNGIISFYDDNPTSIYPDYNYFVTAKVDSGNSGGLAIAEYKNNLCVMGIPTSVKLGNYEIQGMIQSINNVLNVGDLPILINKSTKF